MLVTLYIVAWIIAPLYAAWATGNEDTVKGVFVAFVPFLGWVLALWAAYEIAMHKCLAKAKDRENGPQG